ncbi:MAG: pseudouridine synthase, partial [Gammaproteobacteria bacterium]|nr:pseudouridine synthase [Gammaproteobacteria bacterium]
ERHQLIRQLADLKLNSQQEIAALRERNRENKKMRQAQRLAAPVGDPALLQALSLSSQQDKKQLKRLRLKWQERLDELQSNLDQNYENEIESLKVERQMLSQRLHDRVFETYRLKNNLGEEASVKSLFDGKTPPGGTGDCAAPRLLQYALQNKLTPLALAEFWWGGSPGNGVRHHGEFYPPCRGKCQPILPFMLKGRDVELNYSPPIDINIEPEIVFEDRDIVVLNKPAGLLSVPGKEQSYSVKSWLANKFPDATGPLLVHRLDMATSGLLLATKNPEAHKKLQKQFLRRSVEKRYVAVLSKNIKSVSRTIELPLRVDLDDRPRQMVCYQHGKKAITKMEVISTQEYSSRVYFYPLSGRTHQLRVHAAHSLGLNAPIVGDELYGARSGRMLLHAELLSFDHPVTEERITLESRVPF